MEIKMETQIVRKLCLWRTCGELLAWTSPRDFDDLMNVEWDGD